MRGRINMYDERVAAQPRIAELPEWDRAVRLPSSSLTLLFLSPVDTWCM